MDTQQNDILFTSIFGNDTDNLIQEEVELDGKKLIVTSRGTVDIDCEDLTTDSIQSITLEDVVTRINKLSQAGGSNMKVDVVNDSIKVFTP